MLPVTFLTQLQCQGVCRTDTGILSEPQTSHFPSFLPLSEFLSVHFFFLSSRRKNITSFELDKYNCFKFDPAVSGRYVTLYSPIKKHVVLCEVKIYEATGTINVLLRKVNCLFSAVLTYSNRLRAAEELILYCNISFTVKCGQKAY